MFVVELPSNKTPACERRIDRHSEYRTARPHWNWPLRIGIGGGKVEITFRNPPRFSRQSRAGLNRSKIVPSPCPGSALPEVSMIGPGYTSYSCDSIYRMTNSPRTPALKTSPYKCATTIYKVP